MYSLGLAIPFILSAVLFDRLLGFLKKYGYVVKYAQKIMGVLLIVVGLLLMTSYLGIFSEWLTQVLSVS
jgi:cytochrome c-type biogenesis protein